MDCPKCKKNTFEAQEEGLTNVIFYCSSCGFSDEI